MMGVAEVLAHEITKADIRKINAASNNVQTGGGARDLRFSLEFEEYLDRLFPEEITYEKGTPYRIGLFESIDRKGMKRVEQVRYAFQPTKSRSGELRIAQISKVEFFLDIPETTDDDGILFMAFIRMTSGLPRAQYLTQKQLEAPGSNKIIAASLHEAMRTRRKNSAIVFAAKVI